MLTLFISEWLRGAVCILLPALNEMCLSGFGSCVSILRGVLQFVLGCQPSRGHGTCRMSAARLRAGREGR